MIKLVLFAVALLLSADAFAQIIPSPIVTSAAKTKDVDPPAISLREVSGIVVDSTEESVIGAVITLTSATDTMHAVANIKGVFVFNKVKSSVFTISVKGMSYAIFNRNFKYADFKKYLVLDPIILKTSYKSLKQVEIRGTIGVVYKTDTAEYTANDYKVRKNATVDELLKKMPGVVVSSSGQVTYMGQDVTKAKVNGKSFAGGNVAQAIQNLPADIVNKAQFINDYGEAAERTGNKDGDYEVSLNITTRADKSVGNIARINAGAGNAGRYDERVYLQRINANQQISLIGNIQNTLNGVASGTENSGASGGNTQTGRESVGYRDQWGKHIQINSSYVFNFTNLNVINDSNGQYFSSNGTTNFISNGSSQTNVTGHKLNIEMDLTPDSADFIRISPRFYYSGSNSLSNTNKTLSGYQNQGSVGLGSSVNTAPNFGGSAIYQRLFKKKGRNFFIQVNLNNNDQHVANESNKHIAYRDTLQVLLKDSLQHFLVTRSNLAYSSTSDMSYTEPLTPTMLLNFVGRYNYRSYDNSALTDSINKAGVIVHAPSLSNIFQYSFSEARLGIHLSINKPTFSASAGFTAIPSVLQGTKITLNTASDKTYFHLIPVARFMYKWSKTHNLSINYSASNREPSFTQIQPVIDKSDPQNVIVGNPDLQPTFSNNVNLQYRNYLVDAKLSIGAGGSVSILKDQIINNTIQVPIPNLSSFYNETHFLNINGAYTVDGNYSISKQIASQKYVIGLDGDVSNSQSFSMSNSILYPSTTWRLSQRLGPQINPNDEIEVNGTFGLDINRSFFTQPNALNTYTKIESINIDGRFFIGDTWRIGYSASKNYVQGISYNNTKNPLVVNGYLEKQFFAKRNGTLRLQMFDILNQNNFVNQVVSESSVTNNNTNTQSRYLFLSFVLNLQKWSGKPQKNGVIMQRRGDGSFIY